MARAAPMFVHSDLRVYEPANLVSRLVNAPLSLKELSSDMGARCLCIACTNL